mgnify:CR=1 FL=1
MIKRLVVLQNEALLQEEIAHAPQPALVRPGDQSRQPLCLLSPSLPKFRGPTNREAGMGLKEIAKRAAMEAEKAVLKEVLERVRWNRARGGQTSKISYKALLYKITAAGLDGKVDRRNLKK